jgi:hypothetical protein
MVQAGTQHTHRKERDRKYINRTADNINLKHQSEIVGRDGELATCKVVYTKIINFTVNYVKYKEENKSGLKSVRRRNECNMQHVHTQLETV